MEIYGRRRVRSGWPESHRPPEEPEPAPLMVAAGSRVRWRDHEIRKDKGFCSFLDLQVGGDCVSPLDKLGEPPFPLAEANLWYTESDFEGAACDSDEDSSDGEPWQLPSPVLSPRGSRRASYEDLRSHDDTWSARSPTPIPPTPTPPTPPSSSDAEEEALVARFADLIVKTNGDHTPDSVIAVGVHACLQMYGTCTTGQIAKAEALASKQMADARAKASARRHARPSRDTADINLL